MSTCCCQGIESMFGEKTAAHDLRRYRRKGPSKPTRLLLEALRSHGVAGATVLDIGGGVGAVQHALLGDGAAHVRSVEASSAYLRAAREEAARRGLADRVSYEHGDFVALAGRIPPADVVTLDRVICCYPDVDALVCRSAVRAQRVYGLVYPRDAWWTRAGFGACNLALRIARRPFRAFVHPTPAVDAAARRGGLHRRLLRPVGPVWQVAVYERAAR